MHTLSKLSGIKDSERYCGAMTTHFDEDVGIMSQNSVYIGRGSQFEVRRVILCCDRGSYVQKSVLSAAYMRQSSWMKREKEEEEEEEEKKKKNKKEEDEQLIRAVFLEYRALSHPPIKEHPNIIDILDLGWETDPRHWKVKWPVLILEYADQGTLKAFLARSKFSLETRAKLCHDVARGLTVLHESGIIHGDLKMDNILIFTNPGVISGSINRYTAKLADFGASLVELDGKRKPSFTKPWNAPECFEKLEYTGLKKFDIYSFGLLCWAVMLGGKNPFRFVESVTDHLSRDDWDSSLERLKKADEGARLQSLARESFAHTFEHLKPPLAVIDATLQLEPAKRDLATAVSALEKFLEPLR
jgi:serine/threonine protein kinase